MYIALCFCLLALLSRAAAQLPQECRARPDGQPGFVCQLSGDFTLNSTTAAVLVGGATFHGDVIQKEEVWITLEDGLAVGAHGAVCMHRWEASPCTDT